HSPDDPKERGSPVACVDLESGEELWSIPFYGSHWSRNPAIADGILVWSNTYDNQIYAFGKGQTAVTVEAPLTAVPDGTGVMIRGTVTDQSPGAKDTPAIADASMSEWMQYLYMQFPMPMDATGVPVTLDAVGPDGSFISIGTVNSDASGMFKKMWTPPSEGEYTIIATFAGSGAYWSSYAETSLGVSAESTTLESSYDLYILVAVIILIAIVLIFAFLVFRKQ
ncbi:hypothetical protein KAI12_02105, partial [Candidatus Bathyarchaeota archaeon]|nr:hypothetical protein [Candidatus Bathyarchaeota archaeon]